MFFINKAKEATTDESVWPDLSSLGLSLYRIDKNMRGGIYLISTLEKGNSLSDSAEKFFHQTAIGKGFQFWVGDSGRQFWVCRGPLPDPQDWMVAVDEVIFQKESESTLSVYQPILDAEDGPLGSDNKILSDESMYKIDKHFTSYPFVSPWLSQVTWIDNDKKNTVIIGRTDIARQFIAEKNIPDGSFSVKSLPRMEDTALAAMEMENDIICTQGQLDDFWLNRELERRPDTSIPNEKSSDIELITNDAGADTEKPNMEKRTDAGMFIPFARKEIGLKSIQTSIADIQYITKDTSLSRKDLLSRIKKPFAKIKFETILGKPEDRYQSLIDNDASLFHFLLWHSIYDNVAASFASVGKNRRKNYFADNDVLEINGKILTAIGAALAMKDRMENLPLQPSLEDLWHVLSPVFYSNKDRVGEKESVVAFLKTIHHDNRSFFMDVVNNAFGTNIAADDWDAIGELFNSPNVDTERRSFSVTSRNLSMYMWVGANNSFDYLLNSISKKTDRHVDSLYTVTTLLDNKILDVDTVSQKYQEAFLANKSDFTDTIHRIALGNHSLRKNKSKYDENAADSVKNIAEWVTNEIARTLSDTSFFVENDWKRLASIFDSSMPRWDDTSVLSLKEVNLLEEEKKNLFDRLVLPIANSPELRDMVIRKLTAEKVGEDAKEEDSSDNVEQKKVLKKRGMPLPFMENPKRVVFGEDPSDRGGRDISEQELMKTFGFRGIQYGNWMNQVQRQEMVNLAYDAFSDLSAIMGIPKHSIGLPLETAKNGTTQNDGKYGLGLALGARGRGKAAAHYEPDLHVINLTKTNGNIILGHEWSHALDCWMMKHHEKDTGQIYASQLFSEHHASLFANWVSFCKERKTEDPTIIYQKLIDGVYPSESNIEKVKNYLSSIFIDEDSIGDTLDSLLDSEEYTEILPILKKECLCGMEKCIDLWMKKIAMTDFDPGEAASRGYHVGIDIIQEFFCVKNKRTWFFDRKKTTKFMMDSLREVGFCSEYPEKQEELLSMFSRIWRRWVSENKKTRNFTRSPIAKLFHAVINDNKLADLYGLRGGNTDFYDNALQLDGKVRKYWSVDTELFARSMHAMMYDLADEKGIRDDFLTGYAAPGKYTDCFYRANPNPEGEERQDMLNYFKQNVFPVIQQELRKIPENRENADLDTDCSIIGAANTLA